MTQHTATEVEQVMNPIEGIIWFFAILCTFGFAYPVYRARKNSIHRKTKIYSA